MVNIILKVPKYALEPEFKKALRTVMRQAGQEIAKDARALIRAGNKKNVSAAGQPPISKTGKLASSIKLSSKNNGLKVVISDTAPYALFLEAGAKGGGNRIKKAGRNKRTQMGTQRVLEPRPFLSVAAESNRGSLERRIAEALRQGVDLKKVR